MLTFLENEPMGKIDSRQSTSTAMLRRSGRGLYTFTFSDGDQVKARCTYTSNQTEAVAHHQPSFLGDPGRELRLRSRT